MKRDTQPPSPEALFLAIGEVVSLLAQSDLHRDRAIAHIEELILPPLHLGQIRIWRGELGPVGFATWAFLDDATETAVLHEGHMLKDTEWSCGPNPVVIDYVAPFGNGFRLARDLSRSIFPNRALKSVRRNSDGTVRRIVQHPGLDETGAHVSAAAYAA